MLSLALALCLVSIVAGDIPPTETYTTFAILDPNSMVKLYWKVEDYTITFELHVNTTGWLGMGISTNGGMEESDMVVGWVKDGNVYITDRHETDYNEYPPKDPQQNVELLAGEEKDGWTMIKYRRQLASCEPGYDLPITKDTMKIVYAFGDKDPEGDNLDEFDYYQSNRGTKSLILLDAEPSGCPELPEGEIHSSFDLLNSDFEIPSEKTYYNCRLFKLPTFTTKQHVVKIEPIITPGNERFVHHMVLYQCTNAEMHSENIGINVRCYNSHMEADFWNCLVGFHGWATGGGAFYFPVKAGFPLGEEDSPKHIRIEIHYNNPEEISGAIDSSGFRFTYTEQLREYDAGAIFVGHTIAIVQHLIPPNAESFYDYGDCSDQCLSAAMDVGGVDNINVFAVALHSHLLAKGMAMRHIRGTTELPYLVKDEGYDFNYQELRALSEERTILPGDSLQTVCNFKTKGVRDKFTTGGIQTTQEMCFGAVFYYPKIPLAFCLGAPRTANLVQYFGIDELKSLYPPMKANEELDNFIITGPENITGQTFGQYLNSMEWNQVTAEQLSVDLRDMPREQFCVSQLNHIPGVQRYIPAINITEPYVEEPVECKPAPANPTLQVASLSASADYSLQTNSHILKNNDESTNTKNSKDSSSLAGMSDWNN